MTLPNFIIFGVARCGSTALYEYLQQHPNVFMCQPKEPHFFSFEGEVVDFRGPGDDTSINRVSVTSLEAYERLFDGAGNASAIGEASIEYGYYPKAVDGIRRRIPHARLICMLRNPAERAFSAYSLMRSRALEPAPSFEAALADEPSRIAKRWHHIWHYRQMGFYHPQLKRFFDTFPSQQIRVYLFEEFRADPLRVARDIFEFLGVDPTFVPLHAPISVPGGVPRSPLLQRMLMGTSNLKQALRLVLPAHIRRRVWQRLNAANLVRDVMSPATRSALLAEYHDDILRTQDLLGRDLSHWVRAKPPAAA